MWGPALAFRVSQNYFADPFLEIPSGELRIRRFLYARLSSLRVALGLRNPEMIPWELWIARSSEAYGSEMGGLSNGLWNRLVPYVRGLYREAIEALRVRVPQFPNNSDEADLIEFLHPNESVHFFASPMAKVVGEPEVAAWMDRALSEFDNEPPLAECPEPDF